jgi:hypothetical protein
MIFRLDQFCVVDPKVVFGFNGSGNGQFHTRAKMPNLFVLPVIEFLRFDTGCQSIVSEFGPRRATPEHRSARTHKRNQGSSLGRITKPLGNKRNERNFVVHGGSVNHF